MYDYSDKSDDEINEMVVIAIIKSEGGKAVIVDGRFRRMISMHGMAVSEITDYCGNWVHAGNLMEDNDISIHKYKVSPGWQAFGTLDNTYIEDLNPRRAIAICFLMMNEAKR